ncbi:hypothetical protein EXN65_02135 [Clostridium botulinum]|uniref:Uncharacterized protein n=3 Tax=Clostridium botulinum TaxID=1491 RepID=A0A0A2HJ59_CLOBO|nr:hypothetical protein [Clostridium botulinum]ACQ53633.1 conserved hypothetical protein [Clostridium botulinum Ba4 str. 657]AJE10371.1 hypothetical protein T259_3438 [Clostridium botulinum CDC_1436]AXG91873.1 hypothetical protein AGE29_08785 [Clostridium botulinum]EDT85946.1 conserved hypothetical protein [Clostridium botulinum Bf]KGO15554.1 hypothetical protein NZ45_01280 [Clostridium botulinum]
MSKGKKLILVGVVICLLGGIGIYKYLDTNYKNDFTISDVKWNGETRWWTENSNGNEYNIKFKYFNGKGVKKITSKKSSYDIKINSKIESGDLNIKIYDDKKILFNKNGTLDETIRISNTDDKDVKIEITGKEAKGGYVKLKAM